jgi:hypothetical protein
MNPLKGIRDAVRTIQAAARTRQARPQRAVASRVSGVTLAPIA